MIKTNFILIIIFILTGYSKPALQTLQIRIDYSNLNNQDFLINKIIRNEFDKIASYFKNLLLCKSSDNLYKIIKKNTKNIIQCDNPENKLKYIKENINKYTSLLIFPRININPDFKKLNNPILTNCITKRTNSIVIILDFQFKSVNQMKRTIPINFKNQKYQWTIIRYVLHSIGFNENSFTKLKINNNILLKDKTLLKNSSFFESFQKFSLLTNLTINDKNQHKKYLDFWPSLPNLDDVMKNNINPRISLPSITEITLDALEKLRFKVNPCELIQYKNICYRVNQKCLNEFNYEDYFLQYSLDIEKNRWICYYKTQEHFKNKQCSKDYGVLLYNKEINKNLLISYFRKKDFQTLRLLKPASTCPKPHPRTVFYMSVKEKEDPYQYKILDRVE